MEQVFNDLLQRAEQYSLQTVRVKDEEGCLAGALAFAGTLSTRQIKKVLREICFSPGRELAQTVNLPAGNSSLLHSESCQVTVEERMQLFGSISK
jgi:hypothetical protein